MAILAIALGGILTLLGVGGYVATEMVSKTALIPAAFGIPLIALGVLGLRPALRKHTIHAAAAIALLGIVGTARALPKLPAWFRGDELDRPAAVVAQSLMAIFCTIFVVLAIKSFIDARRSGAAGGPGATAGT